MYAIGKMYVLWILNAVLLQSRRDHSTLLGNPRSIKILLPCLLLGMLLMVYDLDLTDFNFCFQNHFTICPSLLHIAGHVHTFAQHATLRRLEASALYLGGVFLGCTMVHGHGFFLLLRLLAGTSLTKSSVSLAA